MIEKVMKLIIVRHGQAEHNLVNVNRDNLEFTLEEHPQVDSSLTDLGREQASKVSARLSSTDFDLAISSDLKRASATAEAILAGRNPALHLQQWRSVRERSLGDFEGIRELYWAQFKVEGAVEDRDLLTWRIPNGESVVDLGLRVQTFLKQLREEVLKINQTNVTVLVASHGLFIKEVYHVLSRQDYSDKICIPKRRQSEVQYENTGLAQYTAVINSFEDGSSKFEKMTCDILSCSDHLNSELQTGTHH